VCKSTGRIRHNKGGRVFVMKWGLTQAEFFKNYMSALSNTPPSELISRHSKLFPRATLKGKLRRVGYGFFQDYPLQGIEEWDIAAGLGNWTCRE
jgi:hypothetical protein